MRVQNRLHQRLIVGIPGRSGEHSEVGNNAGPCHRGSTMSAEDLIQRLIVGIPGGCRISRYCRIGRGGAPPSPRTGPRPGSRMPQARSTRRRSRWPPWRVSSSWASDTDLAGFPAVLVLSLQEVTDHLVSRRLETSVEFNALRPVTVTDGADSLKHRGPKQRTVLAMLIAHAGRPVSNDLNGRRFCNGWGPSTRESPASLKLPAADYSAVVSVARRDFLRAAVLG